MHSVDKEKIMDLIRGEPEPLSWRAFSDKHKVKISDCYYYLLRREVIGAAPVSGKGKGRRKHIFLKVFSRPSAGLTVQSKNLLREFVEALNSGGRTKMQVVEYPDLGEIEVREVR